MPEIRDTGSAAVVVAQNRNTVAVAQPSATVVESSSPGVQGPTGPAGTAAATVYTAATSLGGHRLVRSTGAGACGYASAFDATHGDDTIGMTAAAASAGAPVPVQASGPITFAGWAWTPGEPVFLGHDGLPTQTPPDVPAAFVQVIGHAESPTTLFLGLEPPIYLT